MDIFGPQKMSKIENPKKVLKKGSKFAPSDDNGVNSVFGDKNFVTIIFPNFLGLRPWAWTFFRTFMYR